MVQLSISRVARSDDVQLWKLDEVLLFFSFFHSLFVIIILFLIK